MLRKTVATAAAMAAASFAVPALAQPIDIRWEVLAPDEKAIIDKVAADFYETALRRSQSYAVEAKTSARYAVAEPSARDEFRRRRLQAYEEMSDAERDALRGAKTPAFANLTEEQKAPFRSVALDQLAAAGAVDQDALLDAMRDDI